MFKADTRLIVPTALTIFVILADFALSTDVSKKLTETAFCVTINRFFLIRFLICIDRTTVRVAVSLVGESLFILAHLLLTCQAFFVIFFDLFLKTFLFSFDRYLNDACRLQQLAYHITSCIRLSTVFAVLFEVFSDFFHPRNFFLRSARPLRTAWLSYHKR